MEIDEYSYEKDGSNKYASCYKTVVSGVLDSPIYSSVINGLDTSMISGCTLHIGHVKTCVGSEVNDNEFMGHFRNFIIFAGVLRDGELDTLFNEGIPESYGLPEENTNYNLLELIKNNSFYLGLVGVYNVSNINILNCVMKYNGKSYSVK